MDTLLSDLKYALRTFRKSPTFAIVAVVTLALGIGANTVIFSLVDAVIIRALPYADPDRVVVAWEDNTPAGFSRNTPAPANYFDWRRMNRSFTDMAATRGATASLTGDGAPEQVLGRAASPSFFTVLGVQPLVGRTFTETEDRDGAHVVVLSYGLWQRRYGGDPSVLGRRILMSDQPYDVIGVMPRSFVFRNRDVDYSVYGGASSRLRSRTDSGEERRERLVARSSADQVRQPRVFERRLQAEERLRRAR